MKASLSQDKSWYVVRTVTRSEAKATTNLRRAGYEVYHPRYRVERINRRSRVAQTFERSLMPGYVFVAQPFINPNWYALRACYGVLGPLGVEGGHGEPLAIPFKLVERLFLDEIDMAFDDTRAARIHRKEEAKSKRETIAMKFPAGGTVKVTEGPFASLKAITQAVTHQGQVDTLVELFGRLTPVIFDAEQLEPVVKRRALA